MKAGSLLMCAFILASNCVFAATAAAPVTPPAGAAGTGAAEKITAAAAEMPAPAGETGTASPAAATGTAGIINFEAAVEKCMVSNAVIRQALAEYREADADAEKVKGRFDLNFKGGVSYADTKDEALAIGMPGETGLLAFSAGLDNRLVTGGDLSLNFTSQKMSLQYPAYNWGIDSVPFRPDINPYYCPEISLSYSQPVLKGFWGDPQGNAVKAAEYRAKSARENLRGEVIRQVCGLKEAGLLIYAQESILKAKKEELKEEENLYARLKSAGAPETDLLLVKAAVLSDKAAPDGLENKLREAREDFLNMAGFAPGEWATATAAAVDTVEDSYIPEEMTGDLEDTLVDMQPQVTAAKLLSGSVSMEKDAAENNSLPELDLTGSYGLTGLAGGPDQAFAGLSSDKFRDITVGAAFSCSFPGREGSGLLSAKKEEMKKMEAEYEKLRNQAKIAVRAAFNGLKAAKDDYEMKKQAGRLLSRRLMLQRAAGAGARELMMSQADYFNAEAAETGSFAEYAKSVIEWNRMNGKYDGYFNDFIKSVMERQ